MAKRCVVLCLVVFWALAPSAALAEEHDRTGLYILLTNDDGHNAPGIKALAEALRELGTVTVAAPEENQSGMGHATTTHEFIRVRRIELVPGVEGYAIAGRPATCVRMGLEALVERRPDLVISGINRGMNLGIVTYYSGTVGAAREAAIAGVAAMAVSMGGSRAEDYQATAALVRDLVEKLHQEGRLRPGLFLNINAPAGAPHGARFTRQSTAATPQLFTRYVNPRDREYYWSDYAPLANDEEGTDVWAVQQGYVAVTPLMLDQTAEQEREWLEELLAAPVPAGSQ